MYLIHSYSLVFPTLPPYTLDQGAIVPGKALFSHPGLRESNKPFRLTGID
jgi:hypothetical protein